MEIRGTETSTSVLRKDKKNADNELERQREVIYDLVRILLTNEKTVIAILCVLRSARSTELSQNWP